MTLNVYYAIDKILEDYSCDNIINENKGKVNVATTFGSKDGGTVRKSKVSFMDEEIDNYYEALWNIGTYINKSAGWNFDIEGIDDVQFTRYAPNEYYEWHSDMNGEIYERPIAGIKSIGENYEAKTPNKIGRTRKLSMTIQLSDSSDYEGGDFELATLEVRNDNSLVPMIYKPDFRNKGSVIAFPSYIKHRVTPVTKGVRYSLVVWFYGRMFK